jgi:hypothetical protein
VVQVTEYDFQQEAEYLSHITQVIIYLKKYMEEHPSTYPPVMRAYNTIAFGVIPSFHIKCKHDSDCRVSAGSPCGGLDDAISQIDEALECLDMELDYEAPPYEYPSSYEI